MIFLKISNYNQYSKYLKNYYYFTIPIWRDKIVIFLFIELCWKVVLRCVHIYNHINTLYKFNIPLYIYNDINTTIVDKLSKLSFWYLNVYDIVILVTDSATNPLTFFIHQDVNYFSLWYYWDVNIIKLLMWILTWTMTCLKLISRV